MCFSGWNSCTHHVQMWVRQIFLGSPAHRPAFAYDYCKALWAGTTTAHTCRPLRFLPPAVLLATMEAPQQRRVQTTARSFGCCHAGGSRWCTLMGESTPAKRHAHWSVLVLCHWIRNLNPTGALQNHSSIAFVRETINPFLADHGMNWGQIRNRTWHGYLRSYREPYCSTY